MWYTIADWAQSKRCDEARRYGSCHCRSGRKGKRFNPCDQEAGVRRSCEAYAEGKVPELTQAEVLAWAKKQVCHNAQCNHRGCIRAGEAIAFLTASDNVAA